MSLYYYKVLGPSETKLYISSNKQELEKDRKSKMNRWGSNERFKVGNIRTKSSKVVQLESASNIY